MTNKDRVRVITTLNDLFMMPPNDIKMGGADGDAPQPAGGIYS
jgi:hypothetical protein